MKDFFDPSSPILEADIDRYAWVGSRVPELVFLYEVRKSYDEGKLLSESEVLRLSNDLEVDIWPLNSWASRGMSFEHEAILDLYKRTLVYLETERIREIVRELPELNLTEDEITRIVPGELKNLINKHMKGVSEDRQAEYDAISERYEQERAARQANKTPEQIAYEKSVTQILDITFSLNSAITEQDKGACQSIVHRASEAIDSAPASLCESSICLNLKALIKKAQEIGI